MVKRKCRRRRFYERVRCPSCGWDAILTPVYIKEEGKFVIIDYYCKDCKEYKGKFIQFMHRMDISFWRGELNRGRFSWMLL